ncbi:MAG: hypothetical protein AAGD33_11700 [Actinomycetota bacterium]
MDFDPIDARLTAATDDFDELVRSVAEGSVPDHDHAVQIATMVALVVDPLRSIVVERLDGGGARPLHVGFDQSGRVTMTSCHGAGSLTVVASHLTLLPTILLQSLRIHPGLDVSSDRADIILAADDLRPALADLAGPAGPTSTWRAHASWRGSTIDSEVRIMATADRGLWELHRLADGGRIALRPRTVAEVAGRLGDVVTGRANRCAA